VKVLELLNKLRNKVGEMAAATVVAGNSTMTMARAGAGGNILNFAQMSSCVGQQALGGRRITNGYRDRTLSIFKKHDLGPEAHGFVRSTFKSGLVPYEFFFHAMTGRDSLMDTALRTPKSGYLYRRLANALQDLKIEYDGTVRNANHHIVQFIYGDDAIDVSKSEGGKLSVVKAINAVVGE
jgi:DNA-directed RNA polymerase subunit A'